MPQLPRQSGKGWTRSVVFQQRSPGHVGREGKREVSLIPGPLPHLCVFRSQRAKSSCEQSSTAREKKNC